MKAIFQRIKAMFKQSVTPSRSEAEQALTSWGIEYERQADGTLLVPGDLDISKKGLTRLPDLSSVSVGGDFSCSNNQLTSLEGAPQSVGEYFSCANNQLTSLEGAPRTFKTLTSDLGDFASWNEVPDHVRMLPETKARVEQERERAFTHNATVLQSSIQVSGPLKLTNKVQTSQNTSKP
jgi:hypothetical protein